MEIVERVILYVWAGLGLLAPVVAFLFFRRAYAHVWLTELQKYQALAGAFVALFAASLGTLGVLLNVRTSVRTLKDKLPLSDANKIVQG
jgi:hypothetical protein